MKFFNLFCGSLLLLGMVNLAQAENIKVKTPRGQEIDVIINGPASSLAKLPALVIAPGQGYHMNLPLIQGLAAESAKNGFITYQFNWAYYSQDPVNGMPAEDLSSEVEDMKTVLDVALGNRLKQNHRQ